MKRRVGSLAEQSFGSTNDPAAENEKGEREEIDEVIVAHYSQNTKLVTLEKDDDRLLETKGFGIREGEKFHLRDYEVLYLLYTNKLRVQMNKNSEISFHDYVEIASKHDKESWSRFLIFRDLRSRGYVVREGFGFPIDFRVYDRGDYGNKAAKYIVFGLNEGKTINILELKENIDQMATMGKEAVVAVVERRGEVIYYKVGKWYPQRSL